MSDLGALVAVSVACSPAMAGGRKGLRVDPEIESNGIVGENYVDQPAFVLAGPELENAL